MEPPPPPTPNSQSKRRRDTNDAHSAYEDRRSSINDLNTSRHHVPQSDQSNIQHRPSVYPVVEDTSNETPRYHEGREAWPTRSAFTLEFANSKQTLTQLAEKASKIFNDNPCLSPEAKKLYTKLEKVKEVPPVQKKVIGLVGNAGQGKSSFLNAITDCSSLAKTLDNGKSVTYVVTKYQQASERQRHRFSARFDYHDRAIVRRMIEDAVLHWQRYHHRDPEEALSNSEHEDRRLKAQTAKSVFHAVFRDMDRFSSENRAAESLDVICQSPEEWEDELDRLVNHVEGALDQELGNGKREAYVEARTAKGLRSWLDPRLSEDLVDHGPALWPFVKEIVIGVKDSRILDHWTIVDLPGLSDIHQVRVEATNREIKKCNYMLLFDYVGRIVDNAFVGSYLDRYAKAFRNEIAVIATKSDDRVDEELVNDLCARFESTRDKVHERRKDVEALDTQLSSISDPRQRAAIRKIRNDKDNEIYRDVVARRSWDVERKLRHTLAVHLPAGAHLKVFSVSNTHYESAKWSKLRGTRQLRAVQTGIPEVRDHLLARAGPPIFKNLANFVTHDFSLFIEGCRLFVRNGLVQGRAQLISFAKEVQEEVSSALETHLVLMSDRVLEIMTTTLKTDQWLYAESAKQDFVVEILEKKKSWATLKAFIRENGYYSTPAMKEGWNTLFTLPIQPHLKPAWDRFIRQCTKEQANLEKQILGGLDRLLQFLRNDHIADDRSKELFIRSVETHREGLRQGLEAAEDALHESLKAIQINTNTEGGDNYFANITRPVYTACQNDSKSGVKARCIDRFKIHLTPPGNGPTPFQTLAEHIENAIGTALERSADLIPVDDTFDAIEQLFTTTEHDEEQAAAEEALRQAIAEFLDAEGPNFDIVKSNIEKWRKKEEENP